MSDRYTMDAATVPTEPQRLRALERANEIRLARAELKRRIADGGVTVAEVLLDVPPHASSWAVWDLLMSQRRWGTSKCRKFLWKNRINETKPVGALTERQRRLLAAQLASCRTPELAGTDELGGTRDLGGTQEFGATPELPGAAGLRGARELVLVEA